MSLTSMSRKRTHAKASDHCGRQDAGASVQNFSDAPGKPTPSVGAAASGSRGQVTRQTVSEWLHHHPGFEAALHSRRQELWAGMTDALRGLLPKALEGEQPLPAAVHVLKACGLYGMPAPQGPTDVEDAVIEVQRRHKDRMFASLAAM